MDVAGGFAMPSFTTIAIGIIIFLIMMIAILSLVIQWKNEEIANLKSSSESFMANKLSQARWVQY